MHLTRSGARASMTDFTICSCAGLAYECNSDTAMADNRYPLTEFGLENLVKDVLVQMGLIAEPDHHGVEDVLGSSGDEQFVLEVTGMDGSYKP